MYAQKKSTAADALVFHMNAGSIWKLPTWSSMPTGEARLPALKAAGYSGIQSSDLKHFENQGFDFSHSGRVDQLVDADAIARLGRDKGYMCTTLHVGHGLETDLQACALIESILEAQNTYNYPLIIETHRATITQDARRTLDFVERFPELRFNADFSHWYTGQEMVYGDFDARIEALSPIFERIAYVHGRISSPGQIQIDVSDPFYAQSVQHFKLMWRLSCEGFINNAKAGDAFIFAPEVLPHIIHYGPSQADGKGGHEETSDRWQQCAQLLTIFKQCWADALQQRA